MLLLGIRTPLTPIILPVPVPVLVFGNAERENDRGNYYRSVIESLTYHIPFMLAFWEARGKRGRM